MKKVIIGVSIVFFILVVGVVGAVIGIYKNQKVLTQKALASLNEQFVGELVVEDSYISPFAQFPYISIDLRGVSFYPNKERSGKALYEAEDLYLGFDIIGILKGDFQIKRIKIANGHLDIRKDGAGQINLVTAKNLSPTEKDVAEKDSELEFDLQDFRLDNFVISYFDELTQQEIITNIGNLGAKVKLIKDHVYLDVESDMVLDVITNGKPSFFSQKHLVLDWEMDYHQTLEVLTILPSKLRLEASLFTLEGKVDIKDDLNTDLKLYGEKPDFNVFAAFAPSEVAETLKRYKNEGQIYFLGTIRGKMADGQMPAVSVEFGCDNAYFVNTAVEKRVDDLRFAGYFTNGKERTLQSSELRLQNFYAKPEEGVFQGRLVIRNFEDPYIKVNLHADLDLQFLGQFFEIEGLQSLRGNILLDMDFDELVDLDMPEQGLAQLKEGLDSELTIKNLSFVIPDYPFPVNNVNGHAVMEKGKIKLDGLSFTIGDSDFSFAGNLSDFPAVFHGWDKPITAELNAKSNKVDVQQLLSHDSVLMALSDELISNFEVKLAFEGSANEFTQFEYLPKGKLRIDDFHAKLKNYPHEFHDFDALITITDTDLSVEDFNGNLDTTDFHFTGLFSNYPKWFMEVPKGDSSFEFDLRSNYIRVLDLLTYQGQNYLPDDYRDEEISNLLIKGKLDLHYDSIFRSADLLIDHFQGKLNVHPLKLEEFRGRLHFEDGNVLMENFGGRMGQSDFEVDLAYFAGEDITQKSRPNAFHLRAKALDLDALMNYDPKSTAEVNHADTFNIFELPFSDMNFKAEIGRMNYHSYWLEDVYANARTSGDHYLYVDSLSLKVADGSLGMSGYFNGSDPENIYFHSTMKADKLDIDKLMVKFDNFGQDVMINENLHGRVSGTIESKFLVHPDLTPIIEKSEAHMDLTVYQGSLVNFTPLEAMSTYFKDKNLMMVRFDTLQNKMDLKDGVLHIPNMNINSSLGYIELSGRQSLDLNMDYFIRVPLGMVTQVGFRSLFAGRNRQEIDTEQEDAIVYRDQNRRIRFVNLKISGNPENYEVSLGRDRN
ncbi:AsmA-like C-terminal region-containing protein [Pleomorphovibrio marinus]|uniref:AsmA-like C-terminal region-containing protein n=1 Tax=Pleomorphovibrio marinus TaxID=2164132 RepID=UPI000E0B7F25|nr:AsmA-like C-terminal region-containing protein [Pleomorphovibrio marinus]